MTWNNAGTAAVVQGGRTVNGTGTSWAKQRPGYGIWFRGDNQPYEIEAVVSPVEITLVRPVALASASGLAFDIIPTQGLVERLLEGFIATEAVFKNARDAWDLVFSNFSGTTYQLWIAQGNTGTVAEFLATLKGTPGDPGPGAYQQWIAQGNTGTFQDFLNVISNAAISAAQAHAAAALASKNAAAQSATSAAASAVATGQDRAAVANVLDGLDDRFLGSKTSNPTLDNDGNPLVAGTRYWNSVASEGRIYNGTAWEAPSSSATASAQAALTSAQNASTSQTAAALSATSAAGHAQAASLASNANPWVPNASYSAGAGLWWSPGNGQPYRPRINHSNRSIDPKDDPTHWFAATAPGVGDMEKSVYDPDDNGVVNAAASVPWAGVSGKPTAFPPATHIHGISAITGLQAALDGKAATGAVFSGSYADLSNRPVSFPPAVHNHTFAQIPGLQAAIDAAGGGKHKFIRTDTISAGSALVDFTLSGFPAYWIDLEQLDLSAVTTLNLRLSDNGGNGFATSGYQWVIERLLIGSNSLSISNQTNSAAFSVTQSNTNTPLSGWISIPDATAPAARGLLESQISNTSFIHRLHGSRTTNFVPNALRLYPTTGTFAAGKIHIYGVTRGA